LYINDLPIVTANKAKLVLYADDTSFKISNPSPIEFASKVNKIFADVNEWFSNNLLSLNLYKTTYLQFQTKNSQIPDSNIILLNNQITTSQNTKFFGFNY
jgi:cell shape-determining protein MreC